MPTTALPAITEPTSIPRILVMAVMPPIIILPQIQITRRHNSLRTVPHVIHQAPGPHLLLIMIPSISRFTAESTGVNGPFVPNVILQQQTLHYLAVLNAMNIPAKLPLITITRGKVDILILPLRVIPAIQGGIRPD